MAEALKDTTRLGISTILRLFKDGTAKDNLPYLYAGNEVEQAAGLVPDSPEVEELRNAHDLAVLAVYTSPGSREGWRSINRTLIEEFGVMSIDAGAGINHAVDRGSLVSERGGILIHPTAVNV